MQQWQTTATTTNNYWLTMTMTQQSTWTSVLCSYSRRENDVEILDVTAWPTMAQPTTTQTTNHDTKMTNHSSNKQQTIMTMQQSTWISVLCSYGRRKKEDEMVRHKTAQPTTANKEENRQRMTNDTTINLDLSPLLLQYGGQENNNKVVFESMKRNRVHLRRAWCATMSISATFARMNITEYECPIPQHS